GGVASARAPGSTSSGAGRPRTGVAGVAGGKGGQNPPLPVAYSEKNQLLPAVRPARMRAVSLSNYSSVRAPAQKKGVHLPQVRLGDDTRRALPVVIAVVVAGTVGLGLAIASVVSNGLTWGDAAGAGVLLVAAVLAEAFPFPIEGVAVGSTSLATIFLVAVAAVYGWAIAAVVGFLAMSVVDVGRRRLFILVAFHRSFY